MGGGLKRIVAPGTDEKLTKDLPMKKQLAANWLGPR